MKFILFIYKIYYGFLSAVAPKVAAEKAFHLFQGVRNKKIRSNEEPFFEAAKSFMTPFKGEDIICYELGNSNGKLVLMVHGWDSHPGAMSAIGFDLAKRGYRVVSFNLPGHGRQKGKRNNILHSANAIESVIRLLKVDHPFAIVCHSFGSAATAFSLMSSGIEVDQLVFLTSPNRMEKVFRDFQGMINLGEIAFDLLVKRVEDYLGKKLDEVAVQNVWKKVNYKRLLVIHDRNDKVIPFENAANINANWPNSELLELEGTGHYKMLWDEKVIQAIGENFDRHYAQVQEKALVSA